MKPKNVNYLSDASGIIMNGTDSHYLVDFENNSFYCVLRFLFYKRYNLNYNIEAFEDEIIQKGTKILEKYLKNKNFEINAVKKLNIDINDEHVNFILKKENTLRCFVINKIFQKNTLEQCYFNYLSHGKFICSKIFQTFINDNLVCNHYLLFFK